MNMRCSLLGCGGDVNYIFVSLEGTKKNLSGLPDGGRDYLVDDDGKRIRRSYLSVVPETRKQSPRPTGVRHRIITEKWQNGRDDSVFHVRGAGLWLP